MALFGVCSLGAVAGALAWHRQIDQSNNEVVTRETSEVAGSLGATLQRYTDITAIAANTLGSGSITGLEWTAIAQQSFLPIRYRGLQGIGFVNSVAGADLDAFVAAQRLAGNPGFTVEPAGSRAHYCVPSAVDWFAGAEPVPLLGYDLCTVPSVAAALYRAETTGRQQALTAAALPPGYKNDVILVAPYYTGLPGSSEERVDQLTGWSVALVDATWVLQSQITPATASRATVRLYVGGRAVPEQLLVSSGPSGRGAVAGTDVHVLRSGDVVWTVAISVLSGYPGLSNRWGPPVVFLALGLLFALSLAAASWLLGRSRHNAMEAAEVSRRRMLESEMRFESLSSSSPVGILQIEDDLSVSYVNPRLEQISGRSAEELLGVNWMTCVHPDDREAFVALARQTALRWEPVSTGTRIVRPDGEVRDVRVLAAPLPVAEPGRQPPYVATVEDVTEELAAREALRFQALHDPLTGLPNRALFLDRLTQALRRAARRGTRPAVLFLDLDRFKLVNDSLGHKVGDNLLVQTAMRLQGAARADETLARLGGDEFIMLLPEVSDETVAVRVAERILRAMDEPFSLEGQEVFVSVSIGIVLPSADQEPDAVLRDADAAMYEAKEQGRARYALFRAELLRRSRAWLTLERELRQGFDQHEFRAFYQPVVDLESDRVRGVEALVRWQHPTRGLLVPAEFIAVAEESGIVVPLGQWIFNEAVRQVAAWDAGPGMPRLDMVSINVSTRQLREPELAAEKRAILAEVGFPPGRVCLEVTETAIMADEATTRQSLAMLHDLGVDLAIDDFGTGYSSLAYLRTLPVTVVKVDRAFVGQLGTSDDAEAIVAAVVDMAHRLGLRVVAEGIEHEAARRRLRDLGCDAGQGYLWTPPLAADEFVTWWQDHEDRRRAGTEHRAASA